MRRLVWFLLLPVLALPPAAPGQEQLVRRTDGAQVPIYDDNLDDAQNRAVATARAVIVRKLLAELVAPEWLHLYQADLRRNVLNRLDRYIGSYRVERSEPSVDRTRYQVTLQAQVNRAQLVHDLRELSLPLLDDPPKKAVLLYAADDPLLSRPAVREALAGPLAERLALLGLTAGEPRAVGPEAAGTLSNPSGPTVLRLRILRPYGAEIALFLAAQEPEGSEAGGTELRAYFYRGGSAHLVAQLAQRTQTPLADLTAAADPAELERRLITPLVNQIQPRSIETAAAEAAERTELLVRVLGFRSVDDEEVFEQAFFRRNTPFERFTLYRIGPEAVTYRGRYGGDRQGLEERLRGSRVGAFTITNAFWRGEELELLVEREARTAHPEMKLFPTDQRTPLVRRLVEDFVAEHTDLADLDPVYAEVEDNGWLDRPNPIPFDEPFYGFVDSRSDSDFFAGEALRGGEHLELTWYRLGRTNLTPVLRLYDEGGTVVRTILPGSRETFVFQVPTGQHRFFVELADRFGYMRWESGGYQSYHYLMRLREVPAP